MNFLPIEEHFIKCLNALELKPRSTIAVAVSGGADSMALLMLLKKTISSDNILALTVNHGFRSQAIQEAHWVSGQCKKYSISHTILSSKTPLKKKSQQVARTLRYQLLLDFCYEEECNYLFLGHQMDDQAETVLMRLLRGAGIRGMSAMKTKTLLKGVFLCRPLLNFTHLMLKEYLSQKKQDWIEDPTNEDLAYKRNIIRHWLQKEPDYPLIQKRIKNVSEHMQRADEYIQTKVYSDIQGVIQTCEPGYITLSLLKFRALHKEAALRLLVAIIESMTGNVIDIRFEKLIVIYRSLTSIHHKIALKGILFYPINETIYVVYERGKENAWQIFKNQQVTLKGINIKTSLPLKPILAVGYVSLLTSCERKLLFEDNVDWVPKSIFPCCLCVKSGAGISLLKPGNNCLSKNENTFNCEWIYLHPLLTNVC